MDGGRRRMIHSANATFSLQAEATSFVVNCGVLGKWSSFAEATCRIALPLRDLVRDIEMKLGAGNEL